MGQIVHAAVRFPTVTLTSALVVALGFWVLVLLGRADVRAFDADAPLLTRSLGGMPVAVAASVVIVSAWLVSITGMLLMDLARLTGSGGAAARVALLVLSTLVAWPVTRRSAAFIARLFPGSPGLYRRAAASSAPYDPGSPPARG
ncbi:hypothetical protein GCM10010269_34600 [Streptomyces humidus]|uniref:Uncharacterized protein n=1 Tax=Streptomyces humidus TaxID=52259 RepID=A0A918FX21_9ACTN|nr:hypothetical protein [Streptomyces humidus]GGR92648.1 hypothetical protein GCM10010269_34600 [Streptomyces humidus]